MATSFLFVAGFTDLVSLDDIVRVIALSLVSIRNSSTDTWRESTTWEPSLAVFSTQQRTNYS